MLLGPAAFARLCRARELLRELDASPPLAQIAAQQGMSPFHFIRLFEALFGETPHQLRIRARIERAKDLLARDMSVTQVCMDVGFSSLGSFSSSFTRRVGESPVGYRRHVRTLVQVATTLSPALPVGCLGMMAQLPIDAFRNFEEA
jgi:AraC-like DNA-binding protein